MTTVHQPVPDHCPECGSTERNYALGVCEMSANVWHGKRPELAALAEATTAALAKSRLNAGIVYIPQSVDDPSGLSQGEIAVRHLTLQKENEARVARGELVVGYNARVCKADHLGHPCGRVALKDRHCEMGHLP